MRKIKYYDINKPQSTKGSIRRSERFFEEKKWTSGIDPHAKEVDGILTIERNFEVKQILYEPHPIAIPFLLRREEALKPPTSMKIYIAQIARYPLLYKLYFKLKELWKKKQ